MRPGCRNSAHNAPILRPLFLTEASNASANAREPVRDESLRRAFAAAWQHKGKLGKHSASSGAYLFLHGGKHSFEELSRTHMALVGFEEPGDAGQEVPVTFLGHTSKRQSFAAVDAGHGLHRPGIRSASIGSESVEQAVEDCRKNAADAFLLESIEGNGLLSLWCLPTWYLVAPYQNMPGSHAGSTSRWQHTFIADSAEYEPDPADYAGARGQVLEHLAVEVGYATATYGVALHKLDARPPGADTATRDAWVAGRWRLVSADGGATPQPFADHPSCEQEARRQLRGDPQLEAVICIPGVSLASELRAPYDIGVIEE